MSLFLRQYFRPKGATKNLLSVASSSASSSWSSSRPLASFVISPLPLKALRNPVQSKSFQQVRFKNKHAKVAQHMEQLDKMAHTKEHNQAQEKRRKKKEKEQARKSKSGKGAAVSHHSDEDNEEDLVPEEEYDVDQTVLPDVKDVQERMKKHIDAYIYYLKSVRGGEPTPELFDDIVVQDAYGKGTGSTPLKAIAQVVISSPTLATATCYDPATAKAVSTAIRDKLELNPQVEEGGVVSIPMPRVSLESRQQTARKVNKRTEIFRQRIRKVRQSAMDVVKQGVAGKLEGISKDDAFRVQQEIEDITAKQIADLNVIAEAKQSEIMQV